MRQYILLALHNQHHGPQLVLPTFEMSIQSHDVASKTSLQMVEILVRTHRGTLLGSSRTPPQLKIFFQTVARKVASVAV